MRTKFKKGDKVVFKQWFKDAVIAEEVIPYKGITFDKKMIVMLDLNDTFEVKEFTFWDSSEDECHDIKLVGVNRIRYDVSWFELAKDKIEVEDF